MQLFSEDELKNFKPNPDEYMMDPYFDKSVTGQDFLRGACDVFAVKMAKMFREEGLKVSIEKAKYDDPERVDYIHEYCVVNNNNKFLYVDARGSFHDYDDFMSIYDQDDVKSSVKSVVMFEDESIEAHLTDMEEIYWDNDYKSTSMYFADDLLEEHGDRYEWDVKRELQSPLLKQMTEKVKKNADKAKDVNKSIEIKKGK